MYKKYKFLSGIITVLLFAACDKEAVLDPVSVSIQGYSTADTVVSEMPVLVDSIITINLAAKLNDKPAAKKHHVRFAVDESKIALYRNKYGDALLLPYRSYIFFEPNCYIQEGDILSDSIALNIVMESLLRPYSTYVLPLVIESVDGRRNPVAAEEVMYLVLKAGKASVISKAEWEVVEVSSDGFGAASRAIDNNESTYWGTNFTRDEAVGAPPHHIVIDFAYEVTFSGVSELPQATSGCPSKIQLEFSLDGNTWTDKGVFDVEADGTLQEMDTGITTARYMRFTALEATNLFGFFYTMAIKEISLIP